jgi:hypothetical protein
MKIYIIAPAKAYTGGPTALFQLCHVLRKVFEVDSYIAFYNTKPNEDPIHENYKHFQCPWVQIDEVYDDKNNVIIVPEGLTSLLSKFNKIKKVIYWLAVDHHIISNYKIKNKRLKQVWFMLKNYPYDLFRFNFEIIKSNFIRRLYWNSFYSSYVAKLIKRGNIEIPKADLHIAQSNYAKNFLENNNVDKSDIVLIREPIEEEFLNMAKKVNPEKKRNIITWNSRKSYPIAFKLVNLLRRKFKIIELYDIGKENMIRALSISKIFIDIGFNPGRDRPVREAIALGNLALINDHGGYYFEEDLPIPTEFKIECYLDYLFKGNYESICKNIIFWINNYEEYLKKFDKVRKYILSEPQLFIEDVKKLVLKLDQM